MNNDTLGGRFETEWRRLIEQYSGVGGYKRDPNFEYHSERGVRTLFKEELERLAVGLEARKWTDDGQVKNYDKENAQAFYDHNTAIDESVAYIRSKAAELV